ncbi:MAG TPA: choice-of-anchor D domain-containing protein [Alphaproteobacteria bacterium]|nr:choice-of-anchor D domain-containing protein [Alphaproteobacteria bacterium]
MTAAVALAIGLAAGAAPARAANFTCSWTDSNANWTTAGDWSNCNGTSPNNGAGNTYDVTISNGGAPQLTSAITIGNVTITNSAWDLVGSPASANLTGGVTNNGGTVNLSNGATLTTTTDFSNSSGNLEVDLFGGQGGSTLNVGGTLTNSNTVDIGNTGLSSATTVTAAALSNTGTINLTGNTSSATQATLNVAGAAGFGTAGHVTGAVNLQGDALLEFGSGALTNIDSTGSLRLNGAGSRVSIGPGTTNSALSGLASNAGILTLDNGATVTTTTGLTNSNTIEVDIFFGEGGSTLNVGGTLTNSNTVNIGNTGLSAATTVTAAALSNTGTIQLFGNSGGSHQATLQVNGPAGNSGTVSINPFANLNVTGGNNYTQTGANSATTIAANASLSAANVAINGGVLQGNGTVTGNVFNSATITGGTNNFQPGTLTINGNFFNAGPNGSIFGSTPGTVATTLFSTGDTQITVGNGHTVTLLGGTVQANNASVTYAAGQTYTVMSFQPGNLQGLFGGIQNGNNTATAGTTTSLGGGLILGVVYNDHAGNIQLEVANVPVSTVDTWNGGTGNWATAGDWSAGVPAFYSDVTIGATSSGDVTLSQDATIQSLAVNNGNTLEYQASIPQTLTVGKDVTVNAGGALSLPTSGDKLALGGNFSNGGTTTLGAGASLLGLGNYTNTGTTSIGSGAQATFQGSATNQAGGHVNLNGGFFSAQSLSNAGTIQGSGTVAPDISNTGLVESSGAVLTAANGIHGIGNITTDTGSTLDLSQSSTDSTASNLANNGSINLGSHNLVVSSDYTNANFGTGNSFNKTAGVTGTGQINASGNVAQAVTGAQVSGGTTTAPTLALGNVHVGTTNNYTYQIANTGTTGPALRGAIQTSVNGGNITNSSLSGTGVTAQNFGPIATGASSGNYTVTYAPTVAGALTGQSIHIANNFANVAEQTMAITGAAYDYANPTVASSLATPFNFGVVQVGQHYTDQLTIANVVVSNAAFQEGLNASFGTITNSQLTASGSITNLAAGQSNNTAMSVTLAPVAAGTIGGTVQVNFASNGATTSGLGITPLASQTLGYIWQVNGTVVNQANPSITPSPINFGNVRINSAQAQALTVTNVAGTPPQASLDAQLTAGGAATSNNLGSINQLLAGQTDNTSFVVGLNTTSAGAQSGNALIALQSDSTPNGCTSNCIVNLTPKSISVSGNVFRLASGSATTPINLGNVRIGTALSGNIGVTNTATSDGFSENLDASVSSTSGAVTGTSGSITGLGAGQTNSTGISATLDSSTAGAKSGTATVAFQSDGTGIDNGAPVSVGSQNVTLTANVFRLASGSAATPVNAGAARVGGTLSTALSVTNTATNDGFSENLDAGVSGTSGAVTGTSGSVTGLGAGQTNSTGITATLDTLTAGLKTGTATVAFKSDGAGIDNGAPVSVGSQDVTVSGKVYAPAVANVQTSSVNFHIVHVGDGGGSLSQGVSVQNGAQATALNDVLIGSISAGGAPFSGSGTLGAGLGAQQSSSTALMVNLSTANAGIFSGTANLALASHDPDLSDLALTTGPISLSAQVNNYAKLGFLKSSGDGTLSGGGSAFTLDFGTLLQHSTSKLADLAFLNDNPLADQAFTDLLSAMIASTTGSGFTLGGTQSVSDLQGGDSQSGFDIGFDPTNLGHFDELLAFNVESINNNFDQTIGQVTLTLEGDVVSSVPVPEPGTLALVLSGLGMLGFAYRRRSRPETK